MFLKDSKIAIVGGGPGGLALARLLQLRGVPVTVYERNRDNAVRVQGATLDLHAESGLEALRRAGLLEAFYRAHRPGAGKLRVMDKDANIHLDDHALDIGLAEDRPEIDRGPLRQLLLDALQPGTVVWDRQFVTMESRNSGWMLHFKNGTTAHADIVIAADGANSRVRPFLTGIQPVYSGVTIVEGNVYDAARQAPRLWELVKGGKVFAFGSAQSLILSAKGDGSLSFYTGCKVPEAWVRESGIDFSKKDEEYRWFREAFAGWNDLWLELFASDEASFIPRPQYHFPVDQSWEARPDLTLIGDAAHRMPPYAGEGVNMALQDAFELADALTGSAFETPAAAIEHYEQGMRERAAVVTQM
ncbi:MAG: FAD-dependent monooxygenase, partial [Sphingobacteriales bacterium]